MVKQFLNLFMWGLSQMTRNGSMRRSACPARQFFLRKLGSQGVQSATPTRHLARPNSTQAFA